MAGGFALLAVLVAGGTYLFENKPRAQSAIVVVPSGAPDSARAAQSADWQKTLANAVNQEYDGTSPTNKVARELSSRYESVFANTDITLSERSEALSELIEKNVVKPASGAPITLDELTVRQDAALDVYAQLVILILRQSSNVREYELVSFSRAIQQKNYSGTPELKEAATIYTRIRNALVLVEVPPSVADEHLALANSVGALANIVSAMGKWSGDPITGLTYLDSFIAAEDSLAQNAEALFEKIQEIS